MSLAVFKSISNLAKAYDVHKKQIIKEPEGRLEGFPLLANSGERLWLIDADFKKNRVRLQFASESGMQNELSDSYYRPYFLVPGEVQGEKAEKIDLFTDQKLTLTKIPGVEAAGFPQKWEDEIPPEMSYVYDKGLNFGLPYLQKDGRFEPVLEEPSDLLDRFRKVFQDIEAKDQLKFELLRWSFLRANQPIPHPVLNSISHAKKIPSENIRASILLSRLANIPVSEAAKNYRVSSWIKSMLHSYYRSHGILIPSATELRRGDQRRSVHGALTVAPQSGTYFGMVVLDFESLYPSCMDVFNLSYETINCQHDACRKNRVPELDVHICIQRRGIYSALIGALRELRIRWYKPLTRDTGLSSEEREEARAAAKILKLILVSCYGVTVRIHGLASPLLGESITAYGRHILKSTWKIAEESGLKPRYGDTDSIFLDNPTDEEVEKLIFRVRKEYGLDLAKEKAFNFCVLSSAMKAYFGILTDGTPDIKGLSAVKSNSPRFFQNVFNDCVQELAEVRGPREFEEAKRHVITVYEHAISDLMERKFELADLAYRVEIHEAPEEKASSKVIPQPYQAARILRDRGVLLKEWDTVSFIKVKPYRYENRTFSVKPAETVSASEVNVEDYVRTLRLALSQVFQPMGIGFGRESVERSLADFI